MEQKAEWALPLGEVEDPEELKARYRIYSDRLLAHWVTVVIGPHREAMAAILRERQASRREEYPPSDIRQ